ncbi:hypothetical protein C3L33_14758, partial [Rhododendron williamsianum]
VDRNKYQIQIPLPPKIDPSVNMITVEEKPDVTYICMMTLSATSGFLILFVVELPMLHPEKFVKLGIDPPKGVLCYGPPGTGKTLLARAVANRSDACFIRAIGSELVQKYVVEGARGARFDDGVDGDNEIQRTMLEIVNQLDGFDARGNIKVLMATNRLVGWWWSAGFILVTLLDVCSGCDGEKYGRRGSSHEYVEFTSACLHCALLLLFRLDTLDPALLRPGRLDRKVEFGLPDLESRTQIFKIHTRTMNCERDIRFELLARLGSPKFHQYHCLTDSLVYLYYTSHHYITGAV